jgi:spermidine synthase
MRRACLFCLFFLSGVCALTYELVWQRAINLIFGVSTLSVSTVLAAFMGGLALGGLLFGRLADRSRNPLRLYALLEAGIGLTGLLVPLGLAVVAARAPGLQSCLPPGRWSFAASRLILSLIVLGLPTTLLGATLPVMSRLMFRRDDGRHSSFSAVYAVNTLGAVVGAALTGLLFLRLLGMQRSLWIAASLNGLIACVAAVLARRSSAAPGEAILRSSASLAEAESSTSTRPLLFCAGLTGALCTGQEVAWSRILGILTSNSAYGFALILIVVLSGLFVGSLVNVWWARRPGNPWLRLAWCQLLLATITLCVGPYFHATPEWLARWSEGATPTRLFLGELLLTAAALLGPAILSGVSLPLLAGLIPEQRGFGRALGRLYATNTLGCAVGPFFTGFVFIPGIGIDGTLGLCFALAVVVSLIGWWQTTRQPLVQRWIALGIAIGIAAAAWQAVPAGEYLKSPVESPRRLLYYAEGDSAAVAVVEEALGSRAILVDGQPVAGTGGTSVVDQKMLAHLPLLLHPAPRRALTVGFGSGGTSHSMSLHGIDVDCVEIEACVPAAADLFASENHGILGNPRYRLILDDARSWLRAAPEPYDAIVTDCTNIQYRSNADLYTTDYFRLMRDRLSEDGVAAAWVPANGIDGADLKTLIRSFRAIFPNTSVWFMNSLPTDFLIVIGTPRPLKLDLPVLQERMQAPAIYADMAAVGLCDARRLAFTLLTAGEALEDYLGNGPINSDDRPVLAYSTYAACYRSTIAANLIELLACRVDPSRYLDGPIPEYSMLRQHAARNEILFGHLAHWSGDEETALAHYSRASVLLPDDDSLASLVRATGGRRAAR